MNSSNFTQERSIRFFSTFQSYWYLCFQSLSGSKSSRNEKQEVEWSEVRYYISILILIYFSLSLITMN